MKSISKNISKILVLFIFIVLSGFLLLVFAKVSTEKSKTCITQDGTKYEMIYDNSQIVNVLVDDLPIDSVFIEEMNSIIEKDEISTKEVVRQLLEQNCK